MSISYGNESYLMLNNELEMFGSVSLKVRHVYILVNMTTSNRYQILKYRIQLKKQSSFGKRWIGYIQIKLKNLLILSLMTSRGKYFVNEINDDLSKYSLFSIF